MNRNTKIELLKVYYKTKGLDLTLSEVSDLQKIARQLQINGINLCNVPNYKTTEPHLFNKLAKILACRGVSPNQVETSQDPRGYCLQITIQGEIICPERFN